jgi:hypothetical protein
MLRKLIIAVLLSLTAAPAWAQEADEIIVTAERYRERYEEFVVPHVTMIRRADSAAMSLTISSDTRDAAARRTELQEALRGLARLGNAQVTLGLYHEDSDQQEGRARIVAFSVEAALELLRPGGRQDTSQVTIILRTPIRANDTLEAVEARLYAFRQGAPRPGRVEYLSHEIELVLTNPPQYRAPVIAAISADANAIVQGLGAGYGVRLEGLENPIAWKRAGDLDLKLFVPYRMVVLPVGAD